MDAARWTAVVGDIVNLCQDLVLDGHSAFDDALRAAEPASSPTAAAHPSACSRAVDALFQRHVANLEAAMTQFEAYARAIWFTPCAPSRLLPPIESSDASEGALAGCCAQVEDLSAEMKLLQAEEEQLRGEQRELRGQLASLDGVSVWAEVLPEQDIDQLKGKLERLFDEARRVRAMVENVEHLRISSSDIEAALDGDTQRLSAKCLSASFKMS